MNLSVVVSLAVLSFATACRTAEVPDSSVRLERAASDVARFLTGHGRFDALDLADTVELYVAPDGGGGRARIPRDRLRDPAAWQVESGGRTRSFLPHGLRTTIVTEPGRYMNCNPSDIATRFPQLASTPHVGVKLEPPRTRSCLETWNATFLFDTTGGKARLIGAIYDQWEW